jgi:dihydropteroate synthase
MDLPVPKLGDGPWIMGVVNVTPDSFSDGGAFTAPETAIAHALALLEAGADVIDIGGESTRPGAEPVDSEGELARILPVIEGVLAVAPEAWISVDTMKPEVARMAVAAGARIWNDVSALAFAPESVDVAAGLGVPVVLMHMQGEPRTMQANPQYEDVVRDVTDFLLERAAVAEAAGVAPHHVWIDPGIGFGKTLEHNLQLMRGLAHIRADCHHRLVFGASRKSFVAKVEEEAGMRMSPADRRLGGSLSAALIAWEMGADMLRVHDVHETVQALRVWMAVGRQG